MKPEISDEVKRAAEVAEEHVSDDLIRGEDYIVIRKRISEGDRVALQNRLNPRLIEVSDIEEKKKRW